MAGSLVLTNEHSSFQAKKLAEAREKAEQVLVDAQNKAKSIIDNANVEAQKLIENARNEALACVDEIKREAHDEGFQAGYKAAQEKFEEDSIEKINSLDNFVKSQFEIKEDITKSSKNEIVDLALTIAEKVCIEKLEDDNFLENLTVAAIEVLKDKETINIIVNPIMAERIYSISDNLKERITQLKSIKIIEDNSVSPDGTIVESPLSRVDSRIKSQIKEISKNLTNIINNNEDNDVDV